MSFLFVDYDQGAGGEYLCSVLSSAPECVTLENFSTGNGRTKVNDIFHQEFLKPVPKISQVVGHNNLIDVVPTHRHTYLAKELLGDIYSIRVKNPEDTKFKQYFIHQRLSKVLLAREPTDAMFIGQLRILQETATNPNFLKQVNRRMDNLSLILASHGIEPTEENRKIWIDKVLGEDSTPEPVYNYDLVIPYEYLFTSPDWIVDSLRHAFRINVNPKDLRKYKIDFDAYYSPN